jgi:[protein-PII] uridylyltransferase
VQAQQHLVAARARGDRAFRLLTEEANVSTVDALRLKEAKEQLFRVRNALHALSNAERDQLVITRQEEIAALLGYGEGETPPVERFMAALYQDMALIRRVAEQVMRRMENSRLILGIGLDCRRRQIVPANDALESDDPVWLLWACELAQKYELEFGERLETAAVALVATNPVLPEPHLAAQVFTRLLSQTGRVYPILQKMADLGILGWYLPEFGAVLDLIPYDPSHDYTVGQHSLLVIRQLDALLEPGGSEERAEMRRALLELAHPEQLMLAALLHDCGKADPNRPHSEVSEELAIRVCARLGWSEEATANVRFLAREHLVMSETSRLRDLSQEETVRDFTHLVGDLERLNMLYLLTYADTSAVGAGVWTQVMARFLRELWQRAAAVLSDEEPLGYDEAAIARARRRLLKDLAPENLPEEEVAEHTQAMPAHYLLNQSLSQIALHIGYVRQVRAGSPVIDFHNERDATYTELTVCTYDDPQPGLLAKIAAVLYAADLDVHSAQVITRVTERDRIALDTLWVDYRGRQLSPGKRREVEQNLRAVLAGTRSASELLAKRRARPTHREAAEAGQRLSTRSIRHDLSETLTVIETVSPDGQGALYWPAEAFSRLGWDIHSARVSRFRAETISSFYVSGARGLSEEQARHAIQEALPVASVS